MEGSETLPSQPFQDRLYAHSKYSDEIAYNILVQIAEGQKSLVAICEEYDITRATFYSWMFKNQELLSNYMSARKAQADSMDDNIMEVCKQIKDKQIDPHAAKVLISAYQWRAERLKPKVYGAQSQITHVREESASAIGRMSVEELQTLRQKLIAAPAKIIDAEVIDSDNTPDSDKK